MWSLFRLVFILVLALTSLLIKATPSSKINFWFFLLVLIFLEEQIPQLEKCSK